MTTQGKWVTDAGDPRIGRYLCMAYRGANCSDGLLGCGELLAPRDPFYEPHGDAFWGVHVLCPACALKHFGVTPPGVEHIGLWVSGDVYEVRLYTAPPSLPALAAQGIADAPAEVREMAPKPCGYAPCGRTQAADAAHAGFCSSLCADTHHRASAASRRLADFTGRLRTGKPGLAGQIGLDSEVRWAEQMRTEELDAIDRQWRALRVRDGEGTP